MAGGISERGRSNFSSFDLLSPLTLSRMQFFSDCGQTWLGRDVPGGKISDEFVHGKVLLTIMYQQMRVEWYPLVLGTVQSGNKTEPSISLIWGGGFTKPVSSVVYFLDFYTPAQWSWKGVYWNEIVCLSVRLTVCRHNPVNALPGAVLLRLRSNLVGTYLGARSGTSSFMGDVAC